MIFWLVIACMTLAAVTLVAWPLLRRGPHRSVWGRAEHDFEIYRDQLAELERELSLGQINADQEEAARAEIGRRMLRAADEAEEAPADAAAPGRSRYVALVLAVTVPLAGMALYLPIGSPGLPGRPASESADARGAAAARQRQAMAFVAELRARVKRDPKDGQAWRMLGRAQTQIGRFDAAAASYARALKVTPLDGDLWSRHGEALTFAADGTVTPQAAESFAAALLADPTEPRARFYLGVAELQAGRRRRALAWWLRLEAESRDDAPWRTTLAARIDRVAAELKLDPQAVRLKPPAPPGPPPAGAAGKAVREAQARQQKMIRGMVARLATRLEESPDDVEGWLRLGRSYQVLEEFEKSRAAFGQAARLRPADPGILSRYAASILRALKPGQAPPEAFHTAIAAALKVDADFANALWLAGMVAERQDRRKEAADYFRRIVRQLKPDSPERAQLIERIKSLGVTE